MIIIPNAPAWWRTPERIKNVGVGKFHMPFHCLIGINLSVIGEINANTWSLLFHAFVWKPDSFLC